MEDDYDSEWQQCLQHVRFNICKRSFDLCGMSPHLEHRIFTTIFTRNHISYFFFVPLQSFEHQSRVTTKQLFPDEFCTPTLRSSPFSTSTGLEMLDVAKHGHFEPKQKQNLIIYCWLCCHYVCPPPTPTLQQRSVCHMYFRDDWLTFGDLTKVH